MSSAAIAHVSYITAFADLEAHDSAWADFPAALDAAKKCAEKLRDAGLAHAELERTLKFFGVDLRVSKRGLPMPPSYGSRTPRRGLPMPAAMPEEFFASYAM